MQQRRAPAGRGARNQSAGSLVRVVLRRHQRRLIARDGMARIGILALLIASLLGACSSPSAGATMSPSVGDSAPPSAIVSPLPSDATFPSEVAGLPVISVASADELLRSGKLDGQAVAVGGYFDQFTPSCPYPGRYIGPLESWCRYVAFTDTRASAKLCQPEGSNGMSCRQPSGTNLAPWFMTETSGNAWSWVTGGATGVPAALVLIGHAGDARQWQCTAATQAECASAFVVDRIAWASGSDVPPTAPETGDQRLGQGDHAEDDARPGRGRHRAGRRPANRGAVQEGRRCHHRPALELCRRRHRVAGALARAGRRLGRH